MLEEPGYEARVKFLWLFLKLNMHKKKQLAMNMYGHYIVERFAQNINAKSLDLHYDCVHTLLLLGPWCNRNQYRSSSQLDFNRSDGNYMK